MSGEGPYYKIFKRSAGDYIYNKVLRKISEIINFSHEVFDRYFKYGPLLLTLHHPLKLYSGSLSFGRLGTKRSKTDEEK